MSAGEMKHFKLKVVDNVGVIVVDSPGAKVSQTVELKLKLLHF